MTGEKKCKNLVKMLDKIKSYMLKWYCLDRKGVNKIMKGELELFEFFEKKIGSIKVNGCEYAFCHPLSLETDELWGSVATCTVVDKEGNFYDLWWLQSGCLCDVSGKPFVTWIGRLEELPEKNAKKIEAYLTRDRLLAKIKG